MYRTKSPVSTPTLVVHKTDTLHLPAPSVLVFYVRMEYVTTVFIPNNTPLPSPQLMVSFSYVIVYYESRKREIKIRLMNEGRFDERLKASVEESTCLTYTGFHDKAN